jgi:hypothetical protein
MVTDKAFRKNLITRRRAPVGRKKGTTRPPCAKSIFLMLAALSLCVGNPRGAEGGEATFPTPSYKKDELATVKEWEKNWAGKKIDASNVDQVADYLPETYRDTIKNPEKWGGKPMWFRIVPYRQLVPTRGFTEATQKNAGKIKMDERMVPVGYADIAGLPFPEPKTGWEIAWNYDFNNRGDSLYYGQDGVQVDPATGSDFTSVLKVWILWFVSRTETPPKPRLPAKDNPRSLRWVSLRGFEHPQNMAGSRIMNYRFLDFSKDDEIYIWMSEFRRVRKAVGSQKVDTEHGGQRAVEDMDGFFNHVIANNYKLLGRKEMLVARHGNPAEWVRVPGQYLYSGTERERVNTYAVEVVSKDPTHIYSKRIWYVDPEDFFIKWTECYDREGKLWRTLENQYGVFENVHGEKLSFLVGAADLARKDMMSGVTANKPRTLSRPVNPIFYTLEGMRKGAY